MPMPPIPPLVPPISAPTPTRPGRHSKRGARSEVGGIAAIVARRVAGTFRGRMLVVAASLLVVASVAAVTAGIVQVATPIGLSQITPSSDSTPVGQYSHHPVQISLPAQAASYLGVFARGVPGSFAPVQSVTSQTGVHPNIVLYYSGWYERFQGTFAVQAQDNGAVPFIQMDPTGISLTAIVAGVYDTYLDEFATAVAGFGAETGHGVIISFGHEMNGYWYPWGYRHTSPAVFVAAWRHIVTLFRQQGADDVTWLWTTNIIDAKGGIRNPAPWWPGARYVTWVGIDGYYYQPSWTFASLFGPTIKAVRALTAAPVPILIAETGASQAARQATKIADLAAGIRVYGLLGFVWFNADGVRDWQLRGTPAFAAFHQVAQAYDRAAP